MAYQQIQFELLGDYGTGDECNDNELDSEPRKGHCRIDIHFGPSTLRHCWNSHSGGFLCFFMEMAGCLLLCLALKSRLDGDMEVDDHECAPEGVDDFDQREILSRGHRWAVCANENAKSKQAFLPFTMIYLEKPKNSMEKHLYVVAVLLLYSLRVFRHDGYDPNPTLCSNFLKRSHVFEGYGCRPFPFNKGARFRMAFLAQPRT